MDSTYFKEIFNIDVYRVNTMNKNDLILQDNFRDIYYSDTTMGKIYNIIKDTHYYELFFLYVCENPKFKEQYEMLEIYNEGIFNKELFLKFSKEKILEILNKNSKDVFNVFRLYIDTITINVYNKIFQPVNKKVIETDKLKYFNIYINTCQYVNLNPELNDAFPHIKFLLQNILQNGYDYFIKFLSWKLKNPLSPVDCHFVIQDDGGTGKTKILSNILSKLVNCVTISQTDLESNHNEFMINALLVLAEEIEGYENEKRIKYYTGVGGLIRINPKGISSYNILNYSNWIFLSNDKKSLKITDKDRRFIIIGGGKRLTPLSDSDWSITLFPDGQLQNYDFFDSETGYHKNFDKEIKKFYQYLISLNVLKKDLLINLPTSKKQELIELNYTSEKKFMIEILDIGINDMVFTYLSNFNNKGVKVDINNYVYFDNKDDTIWFRSFELFELYRAYCKHNNFQHTLNKHNFFLKIPDLLEYQKLFNDKRINYINGKNSHCLKFINYTQHLNDVQKKVFIFNDENKSIIPSEPIDATGEKSK